MGTGAEGMCYPQRVKPDAKERGKKAVESRYTLLYTYKAFNPVIIKPILKKKRQRVHNLGDNTHTKK